MLREGVAVSHSSLARPIVPHGLQSQIHLPQVPDQYRLGATLG